MSYKSKVAIKRHVKISFSTEKKHNLWLPQNIKKWKTILRWIKTTSLLLKKSTYISTKNLKIKENEVNLNNFLCFIVYTIMQEFQIFVRLNIIMNICILE